MLVSLIAHVVVWGRAVTLSEAITKAVAAEWVILLYVENLTTDVTDWDILPLLWTWYRELESHTMGAKTKHDTTQNNQDESKKQPEIN